MAGSNIVGPVSPAEAQAQAAQGNLTAAGINTPSDFAYALLNALGIAPNQGNVTAIIAWESAEGGNWHNSARYNPLNTTQPAPGSSPMNSVGVQSFTSWQQGLGATVQTLRNGRYGGILQALQGTDPYAVARAVGASPWGTGDFSKDIPGASKYGATSRSAIGAAPGGAGSSAGSSAGAATVNEHCVIGGGSALFVNVPCILSSSQVRALQGAMLLAAGGVLMLGGLAVIVAESLSGSGLAGRVGTAAAGAAEGGPVGAVAGAAASGGPKPKAAPRKATGGPFQGEGASGRSRGPFYGDTEAGQADESSHLERVAAEQRDDADFQRHRSRFRNQQRARRKATGAA